MGQEPQGFQRRTANLLVKGTVYHEAEAAFAAGALMIGSDLLLELEHGNPHDRNAVLILLASTRQKLGHVARASAPKYRAIVQDRRLLSSVVTGVEWEQHTPRVPQGRYGAQRPSVRRLRIEFRVRFLEPAALVALRAGIVSGICARLPNCTGVYALAAPDGRTYFGSSVDIRDRVADHVRALLDGKHYNEAMRRAWNGGKGWNAYLVSTPPPARLEEFEASAIAEALRQGIRLFNMTSDGGGGFGTNTAPVEHAGPRHSLGAAPSAHAGTSTALGGSAAHQEPRTSVAAPATQPVARPKTATQPEAVSWGGTSERLRFRRLQFVWAAVILLLIALSAALR